MALQAAFAEEGEVESAREIMADTRAGEQGGEREGRAEKTAPPTRTASGSR